MTEEIIIDECFNCKKKRNMGDNWRTCKLKCSYKYKRKENDYITRLEQELKWANDEEKYLKDCCIKAGKELEKHSFKWDGKEKNLVVQALQLNQLYEKLEQERDKLKKKLGTKEVQLANAEFDLHFEETKTRELKQENRRLYNESIELRAKNIEYKSALEEIKEIAMGIMDDDIDEGSAYYDADQIINKINEVLQ